jgi:hypothetical protein
VSGTRIWEFPHLNIVVNSIARYQLLARFIEGDGNQRFWFVT